MTDYSDWLPPVPCRLAAPGMRPRAPRRDPLSPVSAGSLAKLLRARRQAEALHPEKMAGDQPVCSARIEFLPGTSFASLWGGGTLPGWPGQGIYRALIAYRTQLAAARGYRYLYVDASPDSQPILARLGFSRLARTTPYVWDPLSR
jgi:GNAT superfamily N-acetyltransferase